ncbi:hypothetical protein P280DRAFT_470764 [Massarina eburnea CBS 473.64]|uniref:Uncharacterized protein n=1 Tax=Massarina eburnea CBS 473.64 TaxID=1395130 RepID=A0A6A6RV08_9PLEO|nr:hypothetical protein P280DRAFT_470764 [Massarina eburnea CBS 473.64]
MDLTPVRIRGKKRKASKLPVSNLSSKATASEWPKTSKPVKRKKVRKQFVAAMPSLQGLPQELLEMVFLYSMNTALPHASPDLGHKLSSQAVTMEFVMRSFFHTVDHRTTYRDRAVTSDPAVQSELLACRFFTWSFFLAYVEKAQSTLIKQRGKIWETAGVEVPGPSYFKNLWPFRFTKIIYLGLAEGFKIPEKLLHGPWTEGKASLLYVLVSLNGEIDWEHTMSGETAKEGLKEAIHERNEHAVAALSVLLGVSQAIDTSMLRYAVIDCGCNLNIVRHILFNAQILQEANTKDIINFHDPKLWQWADSHEGKGVFLKDLLRKAEKFSLEFYLEDEDATRAKIVPFPYSGPKFDTKTTLNGIVRALLVNLYRNHGRKITNGRRRRGGTMSGEVMGSEEELRADGMDHQD